MLLKIGHLVVILFLMMAISNASGAEKILFINGIDTSKTDQDNIQKWVDTLNLNPEYDAHYVPTFGPGIDVGTQEVKKATPVVNFQKDPTGLLEEPLYASEPTPTDLNGLNNGLLNNGEDYNTIYAHSGGTRTAVTALMTQNVKTDTLVLMSPVTYTIESKESFNNELRYLLQTGKVNKIIVYESPTDNLPGGEFYQMKYDPNNPGINPIKGTFEVRKLDLGIFDAHKQMWYTVLKDDFGSSPVATPNPLQKVGSALKKSLMSLAKNFAQYGMTSPLLAPPSSEMTPSAMSSSQYSEVSTGPNGNNPQTGYAQVGNMYVWYLDQFHWEGQPDPAHPGVPAVPLHFTNGALNTYGYGWIDLPYSQTGMTYDQGYADMVSAYVASNGGFNGVAAGAGPL